MENCRKPLIISESLPKELFIMILYLLALIRRSKGDFTMGPMYHGFDKGENTKKGMGSITCRF